MSHASDTLDKQTLQTLSRLKLFPWVLDTVIDWGVIIASFYSIYLFPNIFTVCMAILIIGNRQHGLTIMGHEGTHFRICENRKLNDFLANILCFWAIGLTGDGYRKLHKQHHQNTGTEHDPELAHKQSRAPQWDLPAGPLRILKYALSDLAGMSLPDYWIIVSYSKPDHKSDYLPLFLWHALSTGVCLALGLWWVPIIWYFSLVTSFMMSFRLRLWLEHQGTSDTHRLHLTKIQGALLAPHNIWLHWEHHKYSSIPYYNLPKARNHMQSVDVMDLNELIAFFRNTCPSKSGEVL